MNDRKSKESASGADPADNSQAHEGAEEAASHNDAGPDDDKVGYRRPPKATRFQPGRSGNPAGGRKRKASHKLLLDRFEELLAAPVDVTVRGRHKRMSQRDAMLLRLISDANKGNNQARRQVFALLRELDARDRLFANPFTAPYREPHDFSWSEAQKKLFRELEESCKDLEEK